MFHVSIDDKFFFISRKKLVFTELLKELIPIFIKFRYTSKYNEQNHSIDLAYALKNGAFHGLAQINGFSNIKIDTKFKSIYPIIRYYTRFGFLIVAYNDIFIALNLYVKTLSVYDGNGGQVINLSENLDQTDETLLAAIPDINKLISVGVVDVKRTVTEPLVKNEILVKNETSHPVSAETIPVPENIEHVKIEKPAERSNATVAAANFIEKQKQEERIAKIVPLEDVNIDDGLPSMEEAMADAIKDSGDING